MFLDKAFGDSSESKLTKESRKFKGKTDTEYRLTFPAFRVLLEKREKVTSQDLTPSNPEDDRECERLVPMWIGHETAYMQGVGPIIVGSPEVKKFLESKGVKVKPQFGTVVISWPLYDGKVDDAKVASDPSTKVEIAPIIVSLGKYKLIEKEHKNHYLWACDLSASLEKGKPENYQTWLFAQPGKKQGQYNQLKRLLEAAEKNPVARPIVDNIISRILDAAEEVEAAMGKVYNTVDEIKQRLAGDKGQTLSDTTSVEVTSDADVDSILSTLQNG